MKMRFLRAPIDWSTVWRTLLALVVIAGVSVVLVVALGLYNVSAKRGHLPGVSWLLNTAYKNSVKLRAHAEPPEGLMLDESVKLGARHFELACASCHGRPGSPQSATARAILPVPPHISDISDWNSGEYHWIVYEGIKMTGMPAWPSDRRDDVWPVVAFLQRAKSMSADEYTRMTQSEGTGICTMCHGSTNGATDSPLVPRLDILSTEYIANSLTAYRNGARASGIMQHAVSLVAADTDLEIAQAYGARDPGVGSAAPPGPALVDRGRALATLGSDDVPACRACHGPWAKPIDTAFPSLAGQNAPYLRQQLQLWRDGNRGGSPVARLMRQAVEHLTDDDIDELAAYYASLEPAKLNATSDPALNQGR